MQKYDFIVLDKEFMEKNFKECFVVMLEFYINLQRGGKIK